MEHICGTNRIAGFRFSLYPMTDDFISVIKSALKKTDTSKVWTKTDHISTVLRGSIDHVFDAAKAIYLHAANSEQHIVMNGTFSIGCPGDTQRDTYLSKGDKRVNEDAVRGLKAEAPCQFALYPMNEPDYMGLIMKLSTLQKPKALSYRVSITRASLTGMRMTYSAHWKPFSAWLSSKQTTSS